jgi:hypothetical protein
MNRSLRPDVIARVRLLTTAEGGRHRALPTAMFGCTFFFEGRFFDCRLLLDQRGHGLELGQERTEVPIKFLFPDCIKHRLQPAARFKLWDGKYIAEGEVVEVVAPPQ